VQRWEYLVACFQRKSDTTISRSCRSRIFKQCVAKAGPKISNLLADLITVIAWSVMILAKLCDFFAHAWFGPIEPLGRAETIERIVVQALKGKTYGGIEEIAILADRARPQACH
jgi:hypothetical protein